jgi:hypothetical protein
MSKLIRHKWIKIDGFRIHKCEYCNCIRKYDTYRQKLVYYVDGLYLKLRTPDCKRTFNCNLINNK